MVSQTVVWVTFIVCGVLTFLERASFILFFGDRELPDGVQRSLRYVAPAAFAAIVAPRLIDGEVSSEAFVDARVLSAVVAGVVVWRLKNLPLTLIVGLALFWVLRWLGL